MQPDVAQLRTIIHLDLDAFYCAVEERNDPLLRGLPFAVGGKPDERGVVASCSYPARHFGVRSAMPMARALQLCPQLRIISGHYKDYAQSSRRVMQHLLDLTSLVEQISIDEAFLDVSDLQESGLSIARHLQTIILEKEQLPGSLGVASNKLVAKIATEVAKAAHRGEGPPNAIQVVPPGEEAAFLRPLPAELLWGVGPRTSARLAELGIRTIGDIAAYPERDLMALFGKNGHELAIHARGIDERPLSVHHETKSISQETTFARDIADRNSLLETLTSLSAEVSNRLVKNHLEGSTVRLKLRWSDFTTLTRQTSLKQPTDQSERIASAALHLFEAAWQAGKPVRLLGVGVSSLSPRQYRLWDSVSESETSARGTQLQVAVDNIRSRFGPAILRLGSELPPDDQA
ncbi:MAG TPA: DNA polymerase IV [Anaerolineales bacterium]|nr:DNA polymerase IV [Anaerolineales bacterium]